MVALRHPVLRELNKLAAQGRVEPANERKDHAARLLSNASEWPPDDGVLKLLGSEDRMKRL